MALTAHKTEQAASASLITVDGLTIRFGERLVAVADFSLDVQAGQFVSIVGPSGCGKTSVLNVLAGLLPTQNGHVRVLGRAPRLGNTDVAYMPARDSLLPWRSALENAIYGMEIRKIPRHASEIKAKELLEQVGLGHALNSYPKALSHGMRQRCALARTFCLDSPVLLMDEPFGALDVQTKLQLEDVLLELWTREQRTVVFITHDLAEAVALSDRVVVMSTRPGRIIADIPVTLPRPRSVRDLQRDPQFHELYSRLWVLLEQGMEGGSHDA